MDPRGGGALGEVPPSLGLEKNGENVGNEGEKRRKEGQSGRGRKEKDETEKWTEEKFASILSVHKMLRGTLLFEDIEI